MHVGNQPSKSTQGKNKTKIPTRYPFETIIETPGVLIVGLDKEGRILLFNRGCENLTGYKREEVLNRSIFPLLVPKKERTRVRKVFKKLLATKAFSHFVNDWVTKTGDQRTIEWNNSVVTDSEGNIKTIYGIGVDITERVEAETRYRTLFETAPVGLFRTSLDGDVSDINPYLIELLGYSDLESMKDIPVEDYYVDPNERKKLLKLVKKEGFVRGFETRYYRQDGQVIWVRENLRLVQAENGKNYLEGSLEDITEQKVSEATLQLRDKAIASSTSGIIIGDMQAKPVYVNQAYLDIFGYTSKDQVIGSLPMERGIEESRIQEMLQAIHSKGTFSGEMTHYRIDGTPVIVQLTASVIKDDDGNPSHIMASLSDVTEIREAESRYASLFESVPVGLYRTAPGEGKILDANSALAQILGYPDRESLLRKKASSFYVNLDDRKRWESLIAREDVVHGYEAQLRRLDGRLIWVRFNSRAIRDPQGQVKYYEGTLEDITDRKLAQEALVESEERYRTFFETIQDVALQLDSNLTLLDVSPSVEAKLGYQPEELIGKPYPQLNLLAPEELSRALENSKRIFSGDHVPPNEYVFIAKDGSRRYGELNSSPITRNGKIVALYSVVRDITDRKLAEIELLSSHRDLEIYASLLRHDLGNDLQVIFSSTEIAKMMTAPDAELQEFLEATRGAAERMVRMLEVFGRPDKDIEREIGTLLQHLAMEAMKAHKNLNVKISADSEAMKLRISGGRLLPMVFDNLFRNAAQHAGDKARVEVSITPVDERVWIDVVDEGPGIPEEIRSTLFQRGSSTTGSGLGLNLSKRVLEAYEGTIELLTDQKSQKGAAFRITLPIAG